MPSDEFSPPVSPSVCPVPADQQPLNEYKELRESSFFRWGTLEGAAFLKQALVRWSLAWAIAGPVSAASFAPAKHPVEFAAIAALGALIPLVLAFVRLYVGWAHVNRRLRSETISYEESGWYDGQTWTKPLEVRAQDLLVVTYEIKPILQRLRWCLGVSIGVLLGGSLLMGLYLSA